MSIEAALFSHLSTYAGVTALAGTRVYPLVLPQQPVLPAVTYQPISETPVQDRDSRALTYTRTRMQMVGYAATHDGAIGLRDALRGAMGAFVRANNPRVSVALEQQVRTEYEPEMARWRALLDYWIWHSL